LQFLRKCVQKHRIDDILTQNPHWSFEVLNVTYPFFILLGRIFLFFKGQARVRKLREIFSDMTLLITGYKPLTSMKYI